MISDLEPHLEDWIIATKEIYTMAYYMDEQLLVDTGCLSLHKLHQIWTCT